MNKARTKTTGSNGKPRTAGKPAADGRLVAKPIKHVSMLDQAKWW